MNKSDYNSDYIEKSVNPNHYKCYQREVMHLRVGLGVFERPCQGSRVIHDRNPDHDTRPQRWDIMDW